MKTAVAFLAVLSGADAFAPYTLQKTGVSTNMVSADLDGMVGYDIENGKKVFDPWGLSDWVPPEFARKAELANGRSAMLATVGWFFPKVVGTFDSQDVTTTDPIEAIAQASGQWWVQFAVLCGAFETYKLQQEAWNGKSYTGDGPAVLDYTKQWDKMNDEEKDTMRLKELKNARLAMLGIASFVSAHYIPGSVPFLPNDF